MNSVYITDYVTNPDLEKEILGDKLSAELHTNIEVLMVWHEQIDLRYIDSLPNLKGIVRYGVGYDNLDYHYAASKGIYACNTPDYGVEEVADTTIAMILNQVRCISTYDAKCKHYGDGTWQENTLKQCKRLSDIKLGVVGCGRIGSSVVNRAKAMRFQVSFYDPYLVSGYEKVLDCQRHDSLADLLRESDVVSIHTPLSEETHSMVDERFISKMKAGSILVNTARGEIIESLDPLYEGLKSGHLQSVALDVLPQEPPKQHPLIEDWRSGKTWLEGRLIINPHTAYYSSKAFPEMRRKAALNALRIIEGKRPYNLLKEPVQNTSDIPVLLGL